MGTTTKGAPYPNLTDAPNGPAALQALAQWVNDRPGISTFTYAQINALAGADLWIGRVVWQSDTGSARPLPGAYEYDGADWRLPWNMPWGELDRVESSTLSESFASTIFDITGMTLTYDFVANRKVEIRARVGLAVQSALPGLAKVSITDGSNNVIGMLIDSDLASTSPGTRANGEQGLIREDLSGTFTAKLRATTSAGSLAITGNNSDPGPIWLAFRDLGPAGTPA